MGTQNVYSLLLIWFLWAVPSTKALASETRNLARQKLSIRDSNIVERQIADEINTRSRDPTVSVLVRNTTPLSNVSSFGAAIVLTVCLWCSALPVPPGQAVPKEQEALELQYPSKLIGTVRAKRRFGSTKELGLRYFSDPKIKGLTLYISYHEPGAMSLACQAETKTGARLSDGFTVQDLISFPATQQSKRQSNRKIKNFPEVQEGEIIFRATRDLHSLFPRALQYVTVRRFYDEEHGNLVFVASSPRTYTIDGTSYSRISNSICVVPLSTK